MSNEPWIPQSLEEMLSPEHTALVVWDMQHGMAGRAFNLPQVTESVATMIAAADKAGASVVWSRHMGLPNEFTHAVRLNELMRRSNAASSAELHPHMKPGTDEWAFLPGFEPAQHHLVLDKTTPSFFIGTPFESAMRARGIRTLVLSGVATERGIEMTARHAIVLGFYVVIAEDGVGSFTPEGNELGLQFLRQAVEVRAVAEIVGAWDQ